MNEPSTRPPDTGAVESGNASRAALVQQAVKAWTGQLIDLGGRNTLLYYKDLKQGTLDLGLAPPRSSSPSTRSSNPEGRCGCRACSTPPPSRPAAGRQYTASSGAKANENFEERGLRTLFLGLGMATWTNTRGTSAPCRSCVAPPRPHHRASGKAGDDFDLSLPGEWELNPTLLHLLATDYQVHVPS